MSRGTFTRMEEWEKSPETSDEISLINHPNPYDNIDENIMHWRKLKMKSHKKKEKRRITPRAAVKRDRLVTTLQPKMDEWKGIATEVRESSHRRCQVQNLGVKWHKRYVAD